jgi:hypothetical protein
MLLRAQFAKVYMDSVEFVDLINLVGIGNAGRVSVTARRRSGIEQNQRLQNYKGGQCDIPVSFAKGTTVACDTHRISCRAASISPGVLEMDHSQLGKDQARATSPHGKTRRLRIN